MLPYPTCVAFVKQVFPLLLRKTRNLRLLTYGLLRGHHGMPSAGLLGRLTSWILPREIDQHASQRSFHLLPIFNTQSH